MRLITFGELAEYLMHGRDGTTITMCPFSDFEILADKVRNLEIDGISVEKIFDGHLGGLDVLDFL